MQKKKLIFVKYTGQTCFSLENNAERRAITHQEFENCIVTLSSKNDTKKENVLSWLERIEETIYLTLDQETLLYLLKQKYLAGKYPLHILPN